MQTAGQLPRDGNRVPLRNEDWVTLTKSMTFAGATPNDPGDFDGTGNPADLFTVTGLVTMRLFGVCTVALTGASATVEVGTAETTAGLIALTTGTTIDLKEIWHDAASDASIELFSVATEKIVSSSVIQTVKTANVTAGAITYYCLWRPISVDGNVVAA